MIFFLILVCSQIILESLPVSSSGHILLLENFAHYIFIGKDFCVSSCKVLLHFLHGPTVIILTIFFFDNWFFLLKNFRRCRHSILKIIAYVFIADVITFFWYIVFNFSKLSHFFISFPVGLGFLISSLFLLSLPLCKKEKPSFLTWKKALIIGFAQGFALIPGVSRFGLTFVVGCWVGLSARRSFEFSFAIQWPLIFVGFLESLFAIYLEKCDLWSLDIFNFYSLLIIFISSVIAFFALKIVWFMALNNKLWYFSIFLFFSFILWFIFVYIVL